MNRELWATPSLDRRGTALLAAGFALSVLAQVLTLGILPLAGLSLAPSRGLATLPYAAFYIGAALASLPAALLLDSFGRRAAFSLGGSLGAAGGLILVWALVSMHFGALVLGAFWLGIAGGFSLFYRHAAIPVGGRGAGALLIVFGAATLASLTAPTIAGLAEAFASPRIFAGTAAAASLAHVAALIATASLPYHRRRKQEPETTGSQEWRLILLPTGIGTFGWFAMTALMGATPHRRHRMRSVGGRHGRGGMACNGDVRAVACLGRSAPDGKADPIIRRGMPAAGYWSHVVCALRHSLVTDGLCCPDRSRMVPGHARNDPLDSSQRPDFSLAPRSA